MTQEKRVYDWLVTHGTITQMQAYKELGCMRLAAVIFKLRHKGYNIIAHYKTGKNRFGDVISYAEYELKEEEGEYDSSLQ